MRMWMVGPKIMCKNHLFGEHLETHMFVGSIRARKKLTGYVKNGLLEFASIVSRHEQLANEMNSRGYHHKSPLKEFNGDYLPTDIQHSKVNTNISLADLLRRCPRCKELYERNI